MPRRPPRSSDDTLSLRETFDQVPELYDRARPGARVVEIGCGTGQATVPLAERGYRITCVELGERLAALAREKLAR